MVPAEVSVTTALNEYGCGYSLASHERVVNERRETYEIIYPIESGLFHSFLTRAFWWEQRLDHRFLPERQKGLRKLIKVTKLNYCQGSLKPYTNTETPQGVYMSITITSNVIDISPAIRERIESRFEKLNRRQVALISPHVIIQKEGQNYLVEATAGVPNDTLFAQAEDENLYAAIKELGQRLERQLNRYADKPLAQRTQTAQPVAVDEEE